MVGTHHVPGRTDGNGQTRSIFLEGIRELFSGQTLLPEILPCCMRYPVLIVDINVRMSYGGL